MFLSKHLIKSKLSAGLLNMQSIRSVAFVKGDGGLKKIKDKGKEQEEIYFSQQERETMKRLLKKMEAQAEKAKAEENDEESLPKREKKHEEELKGIFSKHGIKDNSGLLKELHEWKHTK